jgi:cation diffusion facilitator family transporter
MEASKENYDFQKIVVVVGASLLIIKFAAYFLTGSVAIFTDAMESIVNVVAGVMGLYALYLSAQPPDRSHPYGHGKVETISASIEGSLISIAGVLIIIEATKNIMNPQEISDLDIGLLLIILAAAVNFLVGTLALRKGRKNRSIALEASGKHLRTDTYSSIGIIIGLAVVFIGTSMGYDVKILDPIIALIFGAIIISTGIRVVKKATDDIMDKADEEILTKVVECLNEHRSEDWIDIHNLRIIKYGSKLHVEMHVTLPAQMTIAEEEEQKRKLYEAVSSIYGDSIDMVMMPEPCKEFSCIHCTRDCQERRANFVHRVNWNLDTLIQGEQHAYGNRVVFTDRLKE